MHATRRTLGKQQHGPGLDARSTTDTLAKQQHGPGLAARSTTWTLSGHVFGVERMSFAPITGHRRKCILVSATCRRKHACVPT
eukprot:364489-Chlamydomonas_euryale.AAC.6